MKITLRALRELVGSTKGIKLPTAKALRESGVEVVANASVGADGRLTVYRNGFYIYQTNIGATVHAVDRCMDYVYDDGDDLDAAQFDDKAWELRLALEGEDRLERNNNAREENKRLLDGGATVEPDKLPDPHDFFGEFENKEMLSQMLNNLTDKQKKAVELYFIESLTQAEVAEHLGIGQRAVSYALDASVKKIKKLLSDTSKNPPPTCAK